MKSQGVLYIVATPIGNLEDITLRALRILKDVDIILCEDTRHTSLLLDRHQVKAERLASYHNFNEQQKIPIIIKNLEEGNKIALVTDAGTPLIADPGFKLVKECLKRKIKIVPIPGPSSLITALTISGLPLHNFFFAGYLPKIQTKRQKILNSLPKTTIVCFETPHRLTKTLNDILNTLGNLEITVCRELTKIHEEIFYGNIKEALSHFKKPKGEFVLIFLKR